MATPSSQPGPAPSEAVLTFAAEHHGESCAAEYEIDVAGLATLLADVFSRRGEGSETGLALQTMHLEELVLARACVAGNERAWEVFLTRYREPMYEAAYKIARDEPAGRALADSLYAELYGLNERDQVRISKLQYYLGRGSLVGWLRTVLAQAYVNQYRRTKRETSLEGAVEEGKQFAARDPEEQPPVDVRVESATKAELAGLEADERFILAAYFIDRHTLAEIAKVMGVHESTISRKLE